MIDVAAHNFNGNSIFIRSNFVRTGRSLCRSSGRFRFEFGRGRGRRCLMNDRFFACR